MRSRGADPGYLREQYEDGRRLAIRQETHSRFSDIPNDRFYPWVTSRLRLRPGDRLLDVGCGNGRYLEEYARAGARVIALDRSMGMLGGVPGMGAARLAASAERIPLARGTVDALAANHMLYHVPDRLAALREMRRVLAPGGRIVLATNAADAHERLRTLHREAAESLGLVPADSASSRFTLDDLALVREVFADAEVDRFENALVFPDVGSVLRYYGSATVDSILDAPTDGSHREPLLRTVAEKVSAIIEKEGFFRLPKTAGCFHAKREP